MNATYWRLTFGETVRTIHNVERVEDALWNLADVDVDIHDVRVETIYRGEVYEFCTGHDFLGFE